MHKTDGLHCQICHEESFKSENASAKKVETGNDMQRGQDLPLMEDGALGNNSNMPDANFSIFGSIFVKIPLEGANIDEDLLNGEVNGKALKKFCLY